MRDVVTSPQRRASYEATGLWDDSTLGARVTEHADRWPDRVAVVDGADGRRITYAELLRDARAVATFLSEHGVGTGDVVSVQLPSRYETVAVDLGVLGLGAVLNPLLPNYRVHELRHIVRKAGSKALFTPARYRGFDHRAMVAELRSYLPGMGLSVLVDGDQILEDEIGIKAVLARDGAAFGRVDAAAVSEVIFTSGTEAEPKAVMHTEQTANCAVRVAAEALELSAADVVWMPSPVGHSTGLNYGVRLALYAGVPLVLQDRWDGAHALDLVIEHGCTYTLAATTFLDDLVRAAEERAGRIECLRLFGCGGAPVPAELVRRAAALGIGVLRLYGSTEGLVVSWNRPSSPLAKRESTDGLLMDGTQMAVRDAQGRQLRPGESGELHVRGPSCCVGFFDDPERTAATFDGDGWIRSGDLGSLDEDGYVRIVGRKKEIIIRGGMNIAPREIEDLLAEMPGVAQAAVVGLPDERLGEVVCACVVPVHGCTVALEGMVAWLTSRQLATYKLPQRLAVFDHLPTTASGKTQKPILVRWLLAAPDQDGSAES